MDWGHKHSFKKQMNGEWDKKVLNDVANLSNHSETCLGKTCQNFLHNQRTVGRYGKLDNVTTVTYTRADLKTEMTHGKRLIKLYRSLSPFRALSCSHLQLCWLNLPSRHAVVYFCIRSAHRKESVGIKRGTFSKKVSPNLLHGYNSMRSLIGCFLVMTGNY